jgi:hypothetical protein
MPTLEVFTIGGGEYIVNVFNAVAAWCEGGGYRSLLQVVMVMGLAYSLCVVAFSLDWRAWLNWFVQSTLIYMLLMVPTVTVKVTDRINPGLAPAVVDNVPLGLGVMASFTSQIGDWMTRTAETVFVMPNAVALSNNGMIYGARLMEKARTFQITDAVFRANLDEQLKQCTFYDVLLGFKSMDDLTRSTNTWAAIGPGSPARSQKWITSTGPGTTEASIIPCNEAYSRLDSQFNAAIDKDLLPFAKNTYPKLADTIAAQKLRDDLPIVAGYMHGTPKDAYSYLKQVSTIDAFLAARESFSDAGWDAYASQRADAQAKNTYTSIAQQAMTWVPLLGIVLTVVFYAMFPVLFPLFLFPRTGVSTLKGYAVGFFYLASWGPLYVILHMFVMSRAASAYAAVAPNGPTLLVADGIDSVNVDISTLAGFLMMSVPFLAAGMAKGAMAIAGQATSMLMPAQNAAEQAATERTTGNYSYGNTSFQNLTSSMVQANKWDTAPMVTGGFARQSFFNDDGSQTNYMANGAMVYNSTGAISNLPQKFTISEGGVAARPSTTTRQISCGTHFPRVGAQEAAARTPSPLAHAIRSALRVRLAPRVGRIPPAMIVGECRRRMGTASLVRLPRECAGARVLGTFTRRTRPAAPLCRRASASEAKGLCWASSRPSGLARISAMAATFRTAFSSIEGRSARVAISLRTAQRMVPIKRMATAKTPRSRTAPTTATGRRTETSSSPATPPRLRPSRSTPSGSTVKPRHWTTRAGDWRRQQAMPRPTGTR